jgi:hypothetical protein
VDWLKGLIDKTDKGQKILLFSHHQPFSTLDMQGPLLCQKLADVLNSGRIHAWYWGHEHRCVIYDVHPRWGMLGRCVGHSGFPYFRDQFQSNPKAAGSQKQWQSKDGNNAWWRIPASNDSPASLTLDGPNRYVEGHASEYGPNGYMVLELVDGVLRETVHTAEGIEIAVPR